MDVNEMRFANDFVSFNAGKLQSVPSVLGLGAHGWQRKDLR